MGQLSIFAFTKASLSERIIYTKLRYLSIIIPVEIIDILSRMVKRITDENWGVDISEGKWGNEGGERRREGEKGRKESDGS